MSIRLVLLLRPPSLFNIKAAVFTTPAVVTLLQHTDPAADLTNILILRQQHVGIAEVVDDLFD